MASDRELLDDYWAAQAQFGPFDVGPDEYLRSMRSSETSDFAVSEHTEIRRNDESTNGE